jgi:hypothetical protein
VTVQVMLENVPVGWQVASPLPAWYLSHLTATVSPVTPLIDPASDLSELRTSVGVQATAEQVMLLKEPSLWQVASPLPVNPSLHWTGTLSPVTPLIDPGSEWSTLFSTLVGEQLFASHSGSVQESSA